MKYYLIVLLVLLMSVPIFADYAKGNAPFLNTWLVLGTFSGDFDTELIQGQPALDEEIQGKKWEYLDDRLFQETLTTMLTCFLITE